MKRVSLEKTVLKLIPKARGKMIREIDLVNKAWYVKKIPPLKLAQIVRDLIREGSIYQPREGFFKRT